MKLSTESMEKMRIQVGVLVWLVYVSACMPWCSDHSVQNRNCKMKNLATFYFVTLVFNIYILFFLFTSDLHCHLCLVYNQ